MPIYSAEVLYYADDSVVKLELIQADPVWRGTYFLEPAAYNRLRRSILLVECEICGGNHPDVFHGQAIIILDHGRDTVEETTLRQLQELKHLFDNQSERQHYNAMQEVVEKFLIDRLAIEQKGLAMADRTSDTVSWELDLDWYDNKMSEIAGEAGYVIYNNSDGGAWLVYASYSEDDE